MGSRKYLSVYPPFPHFYPFTLNSFLNKLCYHFHILPEFFSCQMLGPKYIPVLNCPITDTKGLLYNRYLETVFANKQERLKKNTDSLLGPTNVQRVTKNRIKTCHFFFPFCCICLCSDHSLCNHLEIQEG
jgi:hypothetical protein